MYIAYYHLSKYLLFCFRTPTILLRYEEIANLSEDRMRRGYSQGDGGRDGVSYYSEIINNNACGV